MKKIIPKDDIEIIDCPSLKVYNDKASSECVDYLRRWEDVAKRVLNRELNVILTNISAWNSPNTNGFAGLGGAQMSEILHHVQVAKVKAEKFYGRHHLIQEVLDTLTLAASGMVASAHTAVSSGSCAVGTGDSLKCISLVT